jgi:hypothetical protein
LSHRIDQDHISVKYVEQMKSRWSRLNRSLYKKFRRLVSPREQNSLRSLFRLFQLAVAAVVLVFFVNLLPRKNWSFGEWGDFFGGTLNPILTFLTFMGLLITIIIQQTELRESRHELSRSATALGEQSEALHRQNFESSFFQMIRIQNELVAAIDLVDSAGRVSRGRDCFRIFYTRLNKEYRLAVEKNVPGRTARECLDLAFKRFWNKHQDEVIHYFRYITAILDFVEAESVDDSLYLGNLEALLSDQELLLIFYFCVCEERFGMRLQFLVERKAMLRNLPFKKLLDNDHARLIDSAAFAFQVDV